MPIIDAMFVTNTDICIAWLRKKIAAPVIATLANPSTSGSAAAASEPKTASRISSTIGNPTCSADARSFFARSCIPAHSACWPTRWISTPSLAVPPDPMPSSFRRLEAASAASSWVPLSWSGRTVIGASAACFEAAAAARGSSATFFTRSVPRRTRAMVASTPALVLPGRRARTTASCERWAPSKSFSPRSTAADPEPGTSNPPLVRCSVWRAANGSAASRSTSQAAATSRPWRRVNPSSRSIAACIPPRLLRVLHERTREVGHSD